MGCPFEADENGVTPLHIAAKNGNYDIAKIIIDRLPKMNIDHRRNNNLTSTMIAAAKGNLFLVKYFKRCGADLNLKTPSGTSMLHFAAMSG